MVCQLGYLNNSNGLTAAITANTTIKDTSDEPVADVKTTLILNKVVDEISQRKSYIKSDNSQQTNLKKHFSTKLIYKLYSLLTILFLTIVFWQSIKQVTPPLQILTEHNTPAEPFTYLKGWEYSPTLSSDKTRLAFTHRADNTSYSKVVIQNIKTKQTVILEPENKTFAPYWSPLTDELFYISLSKDNCTVKKVKIGPTLAVSPSKDVTQCDLNISPTGIAVSADLNWLYHSSRDTVSSPMVIKRYHLKNHYTETITAPPGKYEGDASLRLSPDNSKLAFKRYYDDHSESIMLLDTDSGEIKPLMTSPSLGNSIAWAQSSSHVLYLDEEENTLNGINIISGDITSLYRYSDKVTDPLMYSDTEILFALGYTHTIDIQKINLSQKKLTPTTLITSSFRDWSGAIAPLENREIIAFVSNRSGRDQIWIKENSKLQQLTYFTKQTQIIDLNFSANSEKILFLMNDKLYVLNIKSREVKAVISPADQVNNFSWLCHSNNNILISVLTNGDWHLYQVNIQTQESKLLTTGISSIHSQCETATKNSRYYASTSASKGIFQLKDNWKINETFHYFPNINLGYNQEWGVSKDAIYRISRRGEIYRLDFTTRQSTKVDIGDIKTWFITIHNNNLLLNRFKKLETSIAKIAIPDLNSRLNSKH